MSDSMDHAALQSSLWRELECEDNVVIPEAILGKAGSARADVMVFNYAYRTDVRIYEVKRTQADFLSDIRSNKWESYLPFCDRFYFALHSDVDWREHLTHQPVGIMIYSGKTGKWSTARRAPKNAHRKPWNETLCLALMFNLAGKQKDIAVRRRLENEKIDAMKKLEFDKLRYRCDEALRKRIDELRELERKVDRGVEQAEKLALGKIADFLGVQRWHTDSIENILKDFHSSLIEKCIHEARQKLQALLVPADKESEAA